MTQLIKSSTIMLLALSMTACSGEPETPESNMVTETRIDGTISDDMVDVDAEKTGDKMTEDESSEGKKTDQENGDSASETEEETNSEE